MSNRRASRVPSRLTLVAAFVLGLGHALAASVDVTLPLSVSFSVFDLQLTTTGSPNPTSLSFSNADLGPGDSLRISVAADSASFSTPGGGTAIGADAVSWTTSGAIGGTGYSGTLDSAAYTLVFASDPDPSSGSLNVSWQLAPLPSGVRAGDHSLTLRYKLEAF